MTSEKIWKEIIKRAEERPTFLPANKTIMGIILYADVPPKEEEIEGKYGKRLMYLVKTNYGWLALSKRQFLQLAKIVHDAGYKNIELTWDKGVFIKVQ